MGRPSTYSSHVADIVLQEILAGANTQTACNRAGVKRTSWLTWVKADVEGLRAKLAKAKSDQSPIVQSIERKSRPRPTSKQRAAQFHQCEANRPAPPSDVRDAPEIRGECIWSANLAATVLLVEIAGAVFDGLHTGFRDQGLIP